MKNMKRILLTVVSALLLMAVTVAGTLAYLQAETGEVTNTFTVGKVTFAEVGLDESEVDVYGEKPDGTRTTENVYKIVPNHNYIKDPTVHVGDDSEDAYLFVKVTNNLGDLEAAAKYDILEGENDLTAAAGQTGTIAAQMTALGWTPVDGETDVYYFKRIVTAGEDITVFKAFAIQAQAEMPSDEAVQNLKIVIDAYLIQADTFEDANDAWTKAEYEF